MSNEVTPVRMSEMYICWNCKETTSNIRPDYFTKYEPGRFPPKYNSLCDKCSTEMEEQSEFENMQIGSSVTCPACGYEDTDSWEYGECEEEYYECKSCGEPFELEVETLYTYTTKRLKLEEEKENE